MMAVSNADGSIKIKAGIDSSGINSGVKNIEKSVGGLGKSFTKIGGIIAMAFSVTKITQFVGECQKAYQEQMQQEAKLTTIMKQRMNATDDEIASVKNLASEQQKLGVIGDEVQLAGAQQVATFLNESDSINTLLPAMNNLLAQQKGVNATSSDAVNIGNLMGKVLQGQTSALKKVGISFTEAQEQVLKYGTESEKCAMLSQVITDNVGNMNAVLGQTSAGKQQQLANTWGDVKEQFGEAFTQISTLFLPALNKVAEWLSKIAEKCKIVAQGIAKMFGGEVLDDSQAVADATDTALDTTEDIVETEKDVTKEKKKQLFSFDEINKLADSTEETESESASGSGINSLSEVATLEIPEPKTDAFEKTMDKMNDILGFFGTSVDEVKDIVNNVHFDGFKKAGKEAFEIVGKSVQNFWDNHGTEIGKRFGDMGKNILKGSVGFTNATDNVFNALGNSLEKNEDTIVDSVDTLAWGITDYGTTMKFVATDTFRIMGESADTWTKENEPLLEDSFDSSIEAGTTWMDTIGTIFSGVADTISGWWNGEGGGAEVFQNICNAFYGVLEVILNIWNEVLAPFFTYVGENIKKVWEEHLQPVFEKFLTFIGNVWNAIATFWNNVLKPILLKIWEVIGPIILEVLKRVWDVISGVFSAIADVFGAIFDVLGKLFGALVKLFKGDFKGFIKGLWEMIKSVFNGIKKIFMAIVNLVIDGLNLILGAIEGVINGIISILDWLGIKIPKLNWKIPHWEEDKKAKDPDVKDGIKESDAGKIDTSSVKSATSKDLGGGGLGGSLALDDIPHMALGGVIPPNQEFLAVLGDQKSGTNVETPLTTIQDALRNVFAEGYGGDWTIQITDENGNITGEKIIAALERYQKKTGKTTISIGV